MLFVSRFLVYHFRTRYGLQVIRVYTPSSAAEDEIDKFYEDILLVLKKESTQCSLTLSFGNSDNIPNKESHGPDIVNERAVVGIYSIKSQPK